METGILARSYQHTRYQQAYKVSTFCWGHLTGNELAQETEALPCVDIMIPRGSMCGDCFGSPCSLKIFDTIRLYVLVILADWRLRQAGSRTTFSYAWATAGFRTQVMLDVSGTNHMPSATLMSLTME